MLQTIAWSALLGFATGICTYAVATLLTATYGPVFYALDFVEHLGRTLIYGIGGLVILGAAFALSAVMVPANRPVAPAIARLAVVAFAAQLLQLGIVEALAIRSANALSQPIADQLMPFNIGLFAPVGIWQGRPDAAFFWFSAALVALGFAVVSSRVRG